MHAAQAQGVLGGINPPRKSNLGVILQPHKRTLGQGRGYFVKTPLRVGNHALALLMERSWKKEKMFVFDSEFAAFLRDAALAKYNDLLAPPKSIDDDSPFLKGGSHGARVPADGMNVESRRTLKCERVSDVASLLN